MATTINSNTTDGIVITPDTSGEIELQADGVTKAKVTANGLQDANGASLRGGSFRNLIINGDMQIAQRGTSATGLGNTDSGYHTIDRWKFLETGAPSAEGTMSQDTDVPTGQGFVNSLKFDVTTAQATTVTTDSMRFEQIVEAQNLQHLKYGTSSAEKLTLSFWIKSNVTGTYILWIYAQDGPRAISLPYTIDSADTWEKKTITIAGDDAGTINNDNGEGLRIALYLMAGPDLQQSALADTWGATVNDNRLTGQINLMASTSNYINITGVQLEVGEGASDFEFLPYDVQLQRCLRYCFRWNVEQTADNICMLALYQSTNAYGVFRFPVQMRAFPTFTISDAAHFRCTRAGGNVTLTDLSIAEQSTRSAQVLAQASGGIGTTGHAGWLRHNGSLRGTEFLQFDAEL